MILRNTASAELMHIDRENIQNIPITPKHDAGKPYARIE